MRASRVSAGITSPAGSLGGPVTATSAAHTRRLTALANELGVLVAGSYDLAVLRQLRQRLTQWIEDVRSVGGERRLTDAVEALMQRLSAALAGPTEPHHRDPGDRHRADAPGDRGDIGESAQHRRSSEQRDTEARSSLILKRTGRGLTLRVSG